MPSRAISVMLAAVLTSTLIPSTSIAFAADSQSSEQAADVQSAQDAQNAQDANNESSNGADANSDASSASSSAATDRVSETVPVDQVPATKSAESADSSSSSANDGSQAAAPVQTTSSLASVNSNDIEMLTADVSLGENAGMIMSSNGLTYQVNEDDSSTVTLTGWTGNAPQGQLVVPQTIRVNQVDYTVTNICSTGGGSHL